MLQREVHDLGETPHPLKAFCLRLSPRTPPALLAECLTQPWRQDLYPPLPHIQVRKPSLLLSDLPKPHCSEKKELGFEVHLMFPKLSSNHTLPHTKGTSAPVNACPRLSSHIPGDGTDQPRIYSHAALGNFRVVQCPYLDIRRPKFRPSVFHLWLSSFCL